MHRPKNALLRFFLLIFLAVLLVGCQSSLSERGSEELAKYIEELAGGSVTFDVLSAVESPGYSSGELDFSAYTDGPDHVSGCPDDEGGREIWCVVLDREITSASGKLYSHFLVQRLGTAWYVVELGSTEADMAEFYHLGCRNWDPSS